MSSSEEATPEQVAALAAGLIESVFEADFLDRVGLGDRNLEAGRPHAYRELYFALMAVSVREFVRILGDPDLYGRATGVLPRFVLFSALPRCGVAVAAPEASETLQEWLDLMKLRFSEYAEALGPIEDEQEGWHFAVLCLGHITGTLGESGALEAQAERGPRFLAQVHAYRYSLVKMLDGLRISA